ncbi:MAG: hypothetical protein E6J91_25245 [Deltaproteobacteria bacterium]|nr:MAG: hypothetical protein E6J91_25245 [Deltaproteobacteria bacterium]
MEPRPHTRRIVGRRRRGRRVRHGAGGARQRRARLDPHPGRMLRARRTQAHPRSQSVGPRRRRAGRRPRRRPHRLPLRARQRRDARRDRLPAARQPVRAAAQGRSLPRRGPALPRQAARPLVQPDPHRSADRRRGGPCAGRHRRAPRRAGPRRAAGCAGGRPARALPRGAHHARRQLRRRDEDHRRAGRTRAARRRARPARAPQLRGRQAGQRRRRIRRGAPGPRAVLADPRPVPGTELRTFDKRTAASFPFTAPFNMTGQPAITLPLAQSRSGLPIGMMFVARYGDEATLFRLAAQLEKARPWADRHPAIWA